MQLYNRLHKLNTAQIITLGFAGVIILGGLLLWLPFCTAPGYHTSFTDAMFTATTSICVTGLVTVVTATHWTLAGKIIILVLIQIGGVVLMVKKVLQIGYEPERDRLTWDGWDIHCGQGLDVLLPDRLGGGTWRPVSFEYNSEGWYMPGCPGVSPVGLWARESKDG